MTDTRIADTDTAGTRPAETAERAVPRLLLTPLEAGAALGISRTRVFALLASGEIESVQLGRSRRIPVAALEEFVGRLRHGVDGTPGR